MKNHRRRPTLAVACLAALLCPLAEAGRPLATDDAATVDDGCQVEAWTERDRHRSAYVLAPACALAPGLELGADAAVVRGGGETARSASLGLKWAPAAASFDTALGALRLGVTGGFGVDRAPGVGWSNSGFGALALLSLAPSSEWALHFNVGPDRDRRERVTTTLANAAVVWAPSARALVFAELLANDRPGRNGGTVRSAGARWWVEPGVFGIDLTASRTAGAPGTVWSIGFGWYGLGAK